MKHTSFWSLFLGCFIFPLIFTCQLNAQYLIDQSGVYVPNNGNSGYTTISIGGVTYCPGADAAAYSRYGSATSSSSSSSSGHISQSQLNQAIDRENRAYQNYLNNPTTSSYEYWQSCKRVTEAYQQSLEH